MKELTLHELMAHYIKLDKAKEKSEQICDAIVRQEVMKLNPNLPKYDVCKIFFSLEKRIEDNSNPEHLLRFYNVCVWKDSEQKEMIGIIIFVQSQGLNQPDYIVEYLTETYGFIFNGPRLIISTLQGKSRSVLETVAKLLNETDKSKMKLPKIRNNFIRGSDRWKIDNLN